MWFYSSRKYFYGKNVLFVSFYVPWMSKKGERERKDISLVIIHDCWWCYIFTYRFFFPPSFSVGCGQGREYFAVNYPPSLKLSRDFCFFAPKWWKAQSTLTCGFCYFATNFLREIKFFFFCPPLSPLTDVYFLCGFCTLIFVMLLLNWDGRESLLLFWRKPKRF